MRKVDPRVTASFDRVGESFRHLEAEALMREDGDTVKLVRAMIEVMKVAQNWANPNSLITSWVFGPEHAALEVLDAIERGMRPPGTPPPPLVPGFTDLQGEETP